MYADNMPHMPMPLYHQLCRENMQIQQDLLDSIASSLSGRFDCHLRLFFIKFVFASHQMELDM